MCFETIDYQSTARRLDKAIIDTKAMLEKATVNQYLKEDAEQATELSERNKQVMDLLFDDLVTTGTCVSRISVEEFMDDLNLIDELDDLCDLDHAEEQFMKADAGKNMLSLIDPHFVILLGEILSFGAQKYSPNNWQLCEDTSRYKDALLRHLYAYLSGEQLDKESGMSHLGHATFGLMCLNYFDNLNKDQQ